jgi:predicted NUDIX family NTP pyrophosphohydrolase
MARQSSGILLYRFSGKQLQFLLVHPGGPFFRNKDEGSWSIVKGEFMDDEDPLNAAKREFFEETGQPINGKFIELEPIVQKGGKKVYAWAVEADIDPGELRSNLFEIEWPPKSGRKESFPEIDRAAWFGAETAKIKINAAQLSLLEGLSHILSTH